MAKPKAKVLYVVLIVLATLALAEVVLRIVFGIQGYTVGQLTPNWFPQIYDNQYPQLDSSFMADSTGLFRANESYWAWHKVPVNSYGFMGPEWDSGDTSKPKVLLIGDSFVWGSGAEPLSLGFASLLGADTNAIVYNAGIPGADPAQYQFVADKFIPKLQPDVTLVFVYLGNDIVDYKRALEPYKPLYFATDMGWLPGYYEGRYFEDLDSSYIYYKQKYNPKDGFQALACHTAIGTALYSFPLRMQERREREALIQSTITNQHLKAIAQLTEANGSKLYIVPIPYLGIDFNESYKSDPKTYFATKYQNVFAGLEKHMLILPLETKHYHPLPNGHFTNLGHAFVADFLPKMIAK